MAYKSRVKHFALLTPTRRHMEKAVARGSKKVLVDQCFSDQQPHTYISKKLTRILRGEVKSMCVAKVSSKNITWEKLVDELAAHVPTLKSVLQSCTTTRCPRTNAVATTGMCAAILFKFRFRHMSLVQKIISMILKSLTDTPSAQSGRFKSAGC